MFYRSIIATCLFVSGFLGGVAAQPVSRMNTFPNQVRETLSLNKGWKFHLGDIPFPEIKGHRDSYQNAKAGRAWGAAAPGYDDNAWRTVDLPHDWAIESPPDSSANLAQGYRKRGFGWYRRNFKLDPADRGKHLELQFEGISTHCTVWFNGTIIHRNWSGYSSFYPDITALAKYGDDLNTLAIRVDAVAQEGWWYEGAGIYRDVWLVKRSPVHIITDGVFANPVKTDPGNWQIPAEITLANSAKGIEDVRVEMSLLDRTGQRLVNGSTNVTINSLQQAVGKINLTVNNPELWSPETPVLYQVVTTVYSKDKIVDSLVTRCGFRTLRFDADSGFFLNEKNVKLKGVCNHQDHAGVGVAMPKSILEFRLRKLKEMGVNAYRCAHNAPSVDLLDLCDEMGIMVMDENRNFNSSPEYVGQLRWLVRRDRNRPSVILWSVFNEEPMQGTEIGYEMVRRMSAEVKALDTTRPVTAAMNGGLFAPSNVSQAVDVVGFNYQIKSYDKFHEANPTLPLTSSEDVSGVIIRGEYKTDKAKNLLDSYDTNFPSWGTSHRNGWKVIAERPYLAGGFVWTGFDYHGEPTPFQWPTVSSNFGIMDLCGFPKSAYYIHQAFWLNDKDVLSLIPHWNWTADTIGKPIKVMALTNADRVKLLLNGKLISEKPVDKYDMVSWEVPYKPGKLEAIGYKAGKEVSGFSVETTGEPVSLQLIPDRTAIKNNGIDAIPVTVQALDSKGRPVPTANLPVQFGINSSATIIGLGNGNPNSHEPEKGNKRSLFNGLAQVIIQSAEGATQSVVLTAKSPGLKPAKTTIKLIPSKPLSYVPTVSGNIILDKWVVSPASGSRIDPNQEIASNDMNSWMPVKPGQFQPTSEGAFIVFRTKFTPYGSQQQAGGVITVARVQGKAEIWLDGKLLHAKSTYETEDVSVAFPPGKGERTLNILVEGRSGGQMGLGGLVEIRSR
jgi:beta-galactosidase